MNQSNYIEHMQQFYPQFYMMLQHGTPLPRVMKELVVEWFMTPRDNVDLLFIHATRIQLLNLQNIGMFMWDVE